MAIYKETKGLAQKTLLLLHKHNDFKIGNDYPTFNLPINEHTIVGRIVDYLNEGANEIANRIITLDPRRSMLFAETSMLRDNLGIKIKGEVLSVVRENGEQGKLEPCSEISPMFRWRAQDKESLEYRSVYNPAFYIISKKDEYDGSQEGGFQEENLEITESQEPHLYVLPAPNFTLSSELYNRAYVTQRITDYDITEETAHVKGFAKQFQYLIPIYAAIRVLDSDAMKQGLEEEDFENIDMYESLRKQYAAQYETAFQYLGAQITQGTTEEGDADES